MGLRELHKRRFQDPNQWYIVGLVTSENAAWAFDRLRLYNPTKDTKVQVMDAVYALGFATEESTDVFKVSNDAVNTYGLGEQKYSSDNGFEHDFTYDLSGAAGAKALLMSGIPPTANFTQLYSYPTGYGATRGKDADIKEWYLPLCNPDSYLRLENQPLTHLHFGDTIIINATTVYVHNTPLVTDSLNNLIIGCDNNGKSNGTLNYSNVNGGTTPGSVARAAYDNLISKGWSITGPAPYTET